MTAEEYLNQISRLDAQLKRNSQELKMLQENKDDYKGIDYSKIHIREKSVITDPMAEGVAIRLDIEEELQTTIEDIKRKRRAIILDIEQIKDVNTYTVIYDKYVSGYTLQEIANKQYRSESWAKQHNLKGKAFIQSIIDSRKS